MKWIVVATAPDQLTAEAWLELLRRNGIPATLRPGDTVSFLGVTALPCRVLVPENYATEARLALEDLMRASPLAEELEETR